MKQFTYVINAYVRKYSEQGIFTEQPFHVKTVAGKKLTISQVKELWHAEFGLDSIHDLELHRFISINGELEPETPTRNAQDAQN